MKLYKLTDNNDRTYNKTQWGKGVTHTTTGDGIDLCSNGYIHAYTDPYLALFLNPIHAHFRNCHLWEAEGDVIKDDNGLKVGCKSLTTTRRMTKPHITKQMLVKFAILCALEVCDNAEFVVWANNWLSGKDRSKAAAEAAAWATRAAWAAEATAWATRAAAEAAAEAAWAAARAAARARRAKPIDLIAIAHKAAGVE